MDFFNSILSFIEMAYNFLANLATSMINLFSVLNMVVTIPIIFSGIVFPAIFTSITIVLAVGVLYKILGR